MEALNQVSSPMYLVPAYGRIYKNRQEAVEDWIAGKDFKIVGGPYTSVRDSTNLRMDCSTLWILWNNIDAVRIF